MTPVAVRASSVGRVALFVVGALLLIATGAVLGGMRVSPLVFAALGAALFATITAGVAWQGSGVFARPIMAARTSRPELAITFDDGPDPRFTPALLDALESRGHRATFFVIGERAAKRPELLAEMARRGHGLGNHSWSHSYVTNLVPPTRLAQDLVRTNALIASATNFAPRWFRAPVGLLSPRVAAAASLAELDLVAWTASARDGVASREVSDATRRLESALSPGAILVLHDGVMGQRAQSIALPVLERILDAMDARGLKSVTLNQLLR